MATILTAVQGAHSFVVGKGEPSIDNWTFQLFYKARILFNKVSVCYVTSNLFSTQAVFFWYRLFLWLPPSSLGNPSNATCPLEGYAILSHSFQMVILYFLLLTYVDIIIHSNIFEYVMYICLTVRWVQVPWKATVGCTAASTSHLSSREVVRDILMKKILEEEMCSTLFTSGFPYVWWARPWSSIFLELSGSPWREASWSTLPRTLVARW